MPVLAVARTVSSLTAAIAMVLGCAAPVTAPGGSPITVPLSLVSIDAAQVLATVPPTALGVNASVSDEFLAGDAVAERLLQAKIRILRYPGDQTADLYQFDRHAWTAGVEPTPWLAPNATFDDLLRLVTDSDAQALITVNQRTNAEGTGPADPQQAAAWVERANEANARGVHYWEIGDGPAGRAEAGPRRPSHPLEAPSPEAYVEHVRALVAAMREQDSSIEIGLPLEVPAEGSDHTAEEWNALVLPGLCSDIDFVTLRFRPPPPAEDATDGPLGARASIPTTLSALRALLATHCGARAREIEVWVTDATVPHAEVDEAAANAVTASFIADATLTWLEQGAANVSWAALHGGAASAGRTGQALLSNGTCSDYLDANRWPKGGASEKPPCAPPLDTPQPAWHALELVSQLGEPGDELVTAVSNDDRVVSHAIHQVDGQLAVLIINQSRSESVVTTVSIAGFTAAGSGEFLSYGSGSEAVTEARVSDIGTTFVLYAAPQSLNAVILDSK